VPSERDSGQRRAAVARDLARAGGRDVRIELVEYDRSWPARFAAEAARLADAAPGLTWHHIGSTAVPGLPAKPIIDMMALVEDVDAAVPALIQRAGYQFPEAYNATLVARRWLCRPSAAHRTHHLHLVATRSSWPGTCASATPFALTLNSPPTTPRSSANSPTACQTTERATPQPRHSS